MLNILVAMDNNEKVRRLACYLKNSKEVDSVEICHDGVTAVEKLGENQYQAVVFDILLPGYDGFYILSKYAKPSGSPKFVVVTAVQNDDFINKAFHLGAANYMINPIDPGEVLKIVIEATSAPSKTYSKQTKNLNERVSTIFVNIGIPNHILGYRYLRDGVRIAVEKPSIINRVTTELYPAIAELYETTPSKVERAIRHAIEVAWNRGKMENINSLFGVKVFSPNQRPTNSEFIALLADKMLLENY